MSKKQIIGLIISLVLLAALAGGIAWTVINFDKVKAGMDGSGLYTKTDIEQSYEDGYNKALEDKDEYERLIQQYRDSITELSDTISQLNSEVTSLTNTNRDLELSVTNLQVNKTELEKSVGELTEIKSQNDENIASLNAQVTELLAQINDLTLNDGQKQEEIDNLTAQITSLNSIVTQLQNTNNLNLSTIKSLNEQIATLNNNINSMLAQGTQNQNTINALNSRISDLEKSVSYYQQLVAAMQNGDKAVATFMYNDAVYNVQVVDKNTTVTVPDPASTPYLLFNGWSVDGETPINLATYPLTENTTFTALLTYRYDACFLYETTEYASQIVEKGNFASIDNPANTAYKEFKGWSVDGNTIINISAYPITQNTTFYAVIDYKADVTFKVDNVTHDSQIVTIGKFATLPAAPTKDGYVFKGWAVNGSVVDVATYTIQGNTTFTAVFNQKHTVRFVLDGETHSTQQVETGTCASFVTANDTPYISFKGWSLDGVNLIDVNNYTIAEDTEFIAVIVKSYDVIFMNGTERHNAQIVQSGKCADVPANPLKDKYVFVGWSLDGTNPVDVGAYPITENTTFIALFKVDKFEVVFKNGGSVVSTQQVQNGGYAEKPDFNSDTFMGWTVDGTNVVDISSYKITAATIFTAKFGSWTTIFNDVLRDNGDHLSNSFNLQVNGLRIGDKIKLDVLLMQANITDTGNNSYWYNATDGNACYGFDFNGNGWDARDEYGSSGGGFGEITLNSGSPFTSELGLFDYGTPNQMTITVSCKQNNTLTIEWSDNAGFYLENIMIANVCVVR